MDQKDHYSAPYTGSVTHDMIYRALEKNGILLLSPTAINKGPVASIEQTIAEMLQTSEEIREVETIPALMSLDEMDEDVLLQLALEKSIYEKVGYLADKTRSMINHESKNHRLSVISNALLHNKQFVYGNEGAQAEIPLVGGYAASLAKDRQERSDLESKWNIFDPILDKDYLAHFTNLEKGKDLL